MVSWAFQYQVARSLLEFAFPSLHHMGIVHILHHLGVTAPLLVPVIPPLGFLHPYETPKVGGLVVGIVPLLQVGFLFCIFRRYPFTNSDDIRSLGW